MYPGDCFGLARIALDVRSGPAGQDNAGKDPRRAMDRAILHDKAELIYDYHRCFQWCDANMGRPSDMHNHEGTWACNGEYMWRAFSNGKDPHKHLYPNIPATKREWYPIEGSNALYCFRAGPGVNLPGRHELQCSFLSCFCPACIQGDHVPAARARVEDQAATALLEHGVAE